MYDVDDCAEADYENRRRRGNLECIRTYHALEERLGIRVDIKGHIRRGGREGTIVDTAGQYLLVLHDGKRRPIRCHPTANMEYATDAGWVQATPKPDPFAAVR
ncbi:hypothetical protein [Streptomyces sp. NPDC048350]|uniref:hypothetical protein n=1 Tax=Streptomyces sp. NPDC048350 TaxID=3365538 RepID=UPI0037221806